jgi:hypothetical protein
MSTCFAFFIDFAPGTPSNREKIPRFPRPKISSREEKPNNIVSFSGIEAVFSSSVNKASTQQQDEPNES